MAPIITPEELREHVETELSTSALQRLIDDVTEEIEDRFGLVGVDVSEIVPSDYGSRLPLVLKRKPASITSVTSYTAADLSSSTLLDAADYRLEGYLLERLRSGPNPAWGWSSYGTLVVYRPRDDTARRAMAIVDVAKEELAHSGYQSRRLGDYSETKGGGGQGGQSLDQARAAILRRRLAPRGGVVFR